MISVICCSIKPDICQKMLDSVYKTIGVEYEALVFDNREKKYGICKAYNEAAKKAKGEYLCFVHEDVIFKTNGWGQELAEFAQKTTDCGVIGIAGGKWANRNFIAWYVPDNVIRIYDDKNKKRNYYESDLIYTYVNPNCEIFSEAVCLDGVFLFVKKHIWKDNQFDENVFRGFHFYDADFTFSISQKYHNYVYLGMDVFHFSAGNIEKTYCENMYFFQKKWNCKLPYCLPGYKISFWTEYKMINNVFTLFRNNGFSKIESIKNIHNVNNIIVFFAWFLLKSIGIIFHEIPKKIVNSLSG